MRSVRMSYLAKSPSREGKWSGDPRSLEESERGYDWFL